MVRVEYLRLDSLFVKPYDVVSGAEMPTAFIYKRPSLVVIWKKLDRCWEKKKVFSIFDFQTYFFLNEDNKTYLPYIKKRVYVNGVLKTEYWLDPIYQTVLKTISF